MRLENTVRFRISVLLVQASIGNLQDNVTNYARSITDLGNSV